MALDSNLYTLSLQRRGQDPAVLDLIPIRPDAALLATLYNNNNDNDDASANGSSAVAAAPSNLPDPLYTFSRARTAKYNVQLIDAPTQLPLASMQCAASLDSSKTMQLFNPDEHVIFEKRGHTFRQEWKFSFAGNDLIIRRDGRAYVVVADRKPDPEIDLLRYTAPPAKHRPGIVQLLDYNIQRLEVADRRGLEIIGILAVCHCLDQEYDERYKGMDNIYLAGGLAIPTIVTSSTATGSHEANVAISSQPYPESLEPNEILVALHTPTSAVVDHAITLLRQDTGEGMHFIILRAFSTDTTPLAVRVAAEIKARWYKLPALAKGRTLDPIAEAKSDVAEELFQYVRDPSTKAGRDGVGQQTSVQKDDTAIADSTAGPRGRIKLDAPKADSKASSRPSSSNGTASKFHSFIGTATAHAKTPSPTPSHASANSSETLQHASKGNFAAPPSQLAIYLCKDRIDEFERETRTLGDSVSAARIAQELSGATSAPSSEPSPPLPPPKAQKKLLGSDRLGAVSSQASSSASHMSVPHRLLGKLGIHGTRFSES